jgi:hypothetical protein
MAMSAWMEMVGLEASADVSAESSSSTTSMQNSYLHTSLCPCEKNSSQWKHCPSLRRYAISASDRQRILDAGLATDEVDAAEEAAGVDGVVDAGGHDQYHDSDSRANNGGGGCVDEVTLSHCS